METIRIGNDISVAWKIFSRDGLPFPLQGMVTRLYLLSGPYRKEITGYNVTDNVVSFTIGSKSITRYGVYKLLLSIIDKESGVADASFDVVAVFQIVHSVYDNANDTVLDGDVHITPASVLNNVVSPSRRTDVTLPLLPSGSVYEHRMGKKPSVTVSARVPIEGGGIVYRDLFVDVEYIDDNSVRINYSPDKFNGWVYFV